MQASDTQRTKSRVFIVEDHAPFREALAFIFDHNPGFGVAGQAGTIAEASAMFFESVDLAVIDMSLPDGDGVDLIRRLRRVNRSCRIIVLTASLDPSCLDLAVEAGADAVLHKSSAIEEILTSASNLLHSAVERI